MALAALASASAWAEDFPAHAVKLVNNFPPGGPSDILARGIGEVLQQRFKQAVIVENRPGAGGNLGADVVAKSAADGCTVLFTIDSVFTVNPHIYKAMPFQLGDFKPLAALASSGLLIGVHPSTGIKSLADLVAQGKKRVLNFSSGGSGSPGHLAVEVMSEATGMKIQHIPYKGNSPAVTAVLAGEVDAGVLATPGMLPYVKAGKITPLAVTSRRRSALAPDVPTVAEAGLPALEQEVLYITLVPAATPASAMQALQAGLAEALGRPDIRSRMQMLDLLPEKDTGEALRDRLQRLSVRYAKIIQTTGMIVE
jgi:tripartite-type tricarboxylate transporter receptor subunit TctC